jgi:diaminopimelate decarboxylase
LETWSQRLDLPGLLAQCGSNVWIIAEQQLQDNLRDWTVLVSSANQIFFPIKANPSPAVLEI